jgi:hypothetical protein
MINKLKIYEDERGSLIPVEFENLPFLPKRIFTVNNVPINFERGNHSHFETKQFLICIRGSVDVYLHNGMTETIYELSVGDTILIPELTWDKQVFKKKDSEILVICSTEYDINDYIFDFSEFKKIKNG